MGYLYTDMRCSYLEVGVLSHWDLSHHEFAPCSPCGCKENMEQRLKRWCQSCEIFESVRHPEASEASGDLGWLDGSENGAYQWLFFHREHD